MVLVHFLCNRFFAHFEIPLQHKGREISMYRSCFVSSVGFILVVVVVVVYVGFNVCFDIGFCYVRV